MYVLAGMWSTWRLIYRASGTYELWWSLWHDCLVLGCSLRKLAIDICRKICLSPLLFLLAGHCLWDVQKCHRDLQNPMVISIRTDSYKKCRQQTWVQSGQSTLVSSASSALVIWPFHFSFTSFLTTHILIFFWQTCVSTKFLSLHGCTCELANTSTYILMTH